MIVDQIRARRLAALKGGRATEKEILGVALGELETAEARSGALTDDEAAAIVRKLVKSNRETMDLSTDSEQRSRLEEEIRILEELLPRALDEGGLRAALAPALEAIRAAGSDGQATGIAMKALKAAGAVVDGKLVGAVVKKLRE
jgi:uncharacterized protein YqeY